MHCVSGQLIVFYQGTDQEHFLRSMFEFPHVLPVLAERDEGLKELAESRGRTVLFMGADEAKLFFSPDFTFHYSHSGGKPEEVATKLKQDFTVMLFFGRSMGSPIALHKPISAATAAPILVYGIFDLLRY